MFLKHVKCMYVSLFFTYTNQFFKKKVGLILIYLRKAFLKLHTKTGFIESLGYQRSAKVTLDNYIDKVQVVKEINKIGFGYF